MSISYSADGKPYNPAHGKRLAVFMTINAAFASVVVSAWTMVALFVEEPIAWATWSSVSRGNSLLELFYYPFCLLWLMPAAGIMGAWLAHKSRKSALAYTFVLLPIAFMSLIFGWYYFTPSEWR